MGKLIEFRTHILKGIGAASKAAGKFIEGIPVVSKGPLDEFLQDRGPHLTNGMDAIEREVIVSFAAISNPGTGVFLDKMKDMIQIYNHTSKICFDDKQIYLVAS